MYPKAWEGTLCTKCSVSDNYLPSGPKAQNWSQQTDEVASIPP